MTISRESYASCGELGTLTRLDFSCKVIARKRPGPPVGWVESGIVCPTVWWRKTQCGRPYPSLWPDWDPFDEGVRDEYYRPVNRYPSMASTDTVTVSPKYQVVIPERIRQEFHIRAGDKTAVIVSH